MFLEPEPPPPCDDSTAWADETKLEKAQKFSRGACKRVRVDNDFRDMVMERVEELESGKDRVKVLEHNGSIPQVIMDEFPKVGSSQLSRWRQPAERERYNASRKQARLNKSGGRGRTTGGKRRGGGGRKSDWPSEERTLLERIKSRTRLKALEMQSKTVEPQPDSAPAINAGHIELFRAVTQTLLPFFQRGQPATEPAPATSQAEVEYNATIRKYTALEG